MPTLTPGWMRVPRCRTMMLPALISSPAYDLTPSRFDSESRPLRELPPAFLCAMVVAPSARDAVDLEFGVALAMALVLLIVLAPAHLEDLDLVAAAVAHDGGLDRRAGDGRLPEPHAVAFADHQHLIENDLGAHVRRNLLDLHFLAGGNPVLLAARFHDRVHGAAPLWFVR